MNSGFTGSPSAAPDGNQIGFIQAEGTISQAIVGFQANTNYVISFAAAQRTNCCNTGGQDIQVYLGAMLLGTFHPSSGSYVEYSTANFTTTAGSHTVKFAGVDPLHIGVTAFIDNVRINGSPKPGYGIQWLVSDQLGTPRMVFDQSGALANVKRHDYLPFGEELFAAARTVQFGYENGDGVRQQFTQKERDIEMGLDYFEARYYSSVQGRFTSVDPFNLPLDTQQAAESNPERARSLFNAYLSQPQQWNRYSYAINNPLLYVDPTGESIQLSNDKDERERQMQALREAVGAEAAQYLYVNQGTNPDGSANYYVGIYDYNPSTGDKRSFEQVNEVAGEYGAIIRDTQVVKLEFVGTGTIQDDYGDRTYIAPASRGGTPAATGYFKGQLTIKMLDWSKKDLGYLPGRLMSDGKDNMLTPSVMQGHELGHARGRMTGYRDQRGNKDSRDGSLRLENKIRKLQFPNGPTRKEH